MAKVPEHIIEEIRSKVSIAEVVSQYVTLTMRGGRLWGLCPFHQEKTPSFTVQEEKGYYHCFGCGKGGSVFNFLMEVEHISFLEAVSRLAEKAGVTLQQESDTERERRGEREALFELYAKIAESFHFILKKKPAAEQARAYLHERNISDEMVERYKLGYAPADPQWMYAFLAAKHYSQELLAASGLFSRANPRYPLFRNRILFPITDTRGRILGFGGRALDHEQNAKYLNTPETVIFKKRDLLFGLHQGLDAVKKRQEVIICEGYFDVIALSQASVTHCAAPLGTAFTDQQAALLRRYASSCLLFFDSDRAGYEAAVKTIPILEKAGLNVSVVDNRTSYDPADFLQHESAEALQKAVEKRVNSFSYLVDKALSSYDITLPDGKLSVFREVRPYLETIESEIKKQSSLKLLSDLLEIEEEVLYRELGQSASGTGLRTSAEAPAGAEKQEQYYPLQPANMSPDMYLMLTIVNNRKYFQEVRQSITVKQIHDKFAADIYTALEESLREGESSFEYLLERLEYDTSRQAAVSCYGIEEFSDEGEAQRIIEDTVRTIMIRDLTVRRKQVEHQIRTSVLQGINEIELNELLYRKKFIDEEITKLRTP
jgi:DNA primase